MKKIEIKRKIMELEPYTEVKLLRAFVSLMSALALLAISSLGAFVFSISSTSAGQEVQIKDNEKRIQIMAVDMKAVSEKLDEMNRELGEMQERSKGAEKTQDQMQVSQGQIMQILLKIRDQTE